MFKYTKAAVNVFIRDMKIIANILKYGALSLSLAYYIYALVVGIGNNIINIILVSIIGCFALFELITLPFDINKLTKKIVNKIYKWSKLVIKAFTLGTTLYSLYLSSTTTNGLSIVLATLTTIIFVLQLIIEIISILFDRYKDLLFEAAKQDVDEMKNNLSKPAEKVINVVRKIGGKEPIDIVPIEKSKKIIKLEKRMAKLEKKKEKLNKKKNENIM